MPPSAATQSTTAAAHTSAAASRHDPAETSDAETEPLPYDDDEQDGAADDVMDLNDLAQHAAASAAAAVDSDLDAPGEAADVSMEHSQLEPSQAEDPADEEDDDDDDGADGHDAVPGSQLSAAQDPNSNMSSPQKTGGFTGDEFSDESELTDEDDDQNEDEDGSSLSDDDLGGSDDEDEEEDEEDDDADSKTHEDEAAEALAALTGGAEGAADDAGAAAGLDALAALATAGEADADDGEDVDEDEDDDVSDGEVAQTAAGPRASLIGAAKPGRLQQLRQEGDGDDLSSDITPEPEDGADGSDQEDAGSPRDTDLDLIASMKKRAAATGGATSLLEPEQLVDSLPGSASTSRAGSVLGDDDEAEKADTVEDHDADSKAPEAEQAEAEHLDTAAGTPAPDAAEHEDDTSTDEAAIRRQDAMEALTKIEIGFAMLRDRLYVERLQEISKEGDMILDGTHPELLHLNKAIEMRRQRRTELVEMWFEQQEQQYERVAKAEEFAAWSIWRSSCASLRRDMMDEYSRKRRRLDREKRTLDAPRPARRHQIFETELVRNPDRLHIPLDPAALMQGGERAEVNGAKGGRKGSAKRKAIAREIDAGDEFVAYPDLKGLAEADVMMDIEQMGIRPGGVPPGMYDPFYGAPVGLEFQNPEVYAMYGPEAAAAAAAAAAAQAHMNGMPYGLPPGARGMPPPPPGMMAPGTPGSVHTPHRQGMPPLPPPPPGAMHPGMEMGMMGFDPYAAAEMERAARMHHREQQARMGLDPNDPHHRSSPFPPDMYAPYPPHFLPPGAGGPMNAGRGGMPPSPTPPHRSGRKERGSADDVHASGGRGRGSVKTTGRSKPRAHRDGVSPPHGKGKTNLPPPPSMSSGAVGGVDERDIKMSNGTARHPAHRDSAKAMGPGFGAGRPGPPAATPVATAAAAGVGNRSLYPSD
ncbi:Sds3-like protein [Kalmanozyma brasiliensis GHG001]|uniref:Sds3-like protein n=1 Tax=Kalmanozyma brasiliensis (strain GHG001) TaxID=1365824 RepID=UPI002867FFB5|nr:Sds3-like protein [Kalmanozyma brasiliensis GHG001]KAF6767230.1 Sds3-like protein [Kalmanozyma brasiliensis GHG001]